MTTPQNATVSAQDTVIVVDYGSDDAQLLARRIREAKVYSEVHAYTAGASAILGAQPAALVIAARSTTTEELPEIDPQLLNAGIPVLAVGGGFLAVTKALGGTVTLDAASNQVLALDNVDDNSTLFSGQPATQNVATNHAHIITEPSDGFVVTASHTSMPVAAAENSEQQLYGMLWNPGGEDSTHGQAAIKNFLFIAADLSPDWSVEQVIEQQVTKIREQIGDKRALVGLSGGVDSAVAAALVQRAVGDQLTAVYVNHGLMRKDESVEIEQAFGASTGGAKLIMIDAEEEFLSALDGVSDPEAKRKIIGARFIRTFERAQAEIVAESANDPNATAVQFLVQGTVYPDVIESGDADGSKVIKSHHNVGGLPEDIEFELVEPLRQLFKDEVRAVGTKLGLPDEIVWRQPFPGPGLGIRIVGAVSKERLDLLREADAIVREELTASGLDREIWQSPVVLLADVRSVGVNDGGRTYGHPVVLRPVLSEDAMTARFARIPYDILDRISQRITDEVDGINRVVLDITGKPPGTIEWE
ncbi:MAG: glutamine-hydrolyzing GMP synthase [Yaniella sp.]|uniref:glutamine-hydrolyzing GMP synthase n=2 Tax=Yaniella sp. TaxID=2773929 RepID=UPI0026489E4E|nr:glutamine-hydrolyzing GMP synthase [Yaniella sp.]MDN5705148.1 glutamine-hydrolyzing GMP synthase [Yaniella sp.]MDN5731750.1 glutamine-hydrolyzing GMP synthase [Yaniella sp.]MDN5742106.1 glutamine-hydrolyzing GMP synthase [Yaniella sp.]MDN5815612.1 glutamine-hydrolyzing GMP synthase [Yaniella sp.]MDN5818267.1 glutamine-hydrolyzing GMP synthase [Yaniella sp.]